jgi:hypothetical protein
MTENRTPTGQLWLAPLPGRFFVVPDAASPSTGAVPVGAVWVADLDTGAARVDLAAWAGFEVDESAARAHYRTRLSAGASTLAAAGARATSALTTALPGLGALIERLAGDAPDALDGPTALALLSGRPRAEVEAAPEAARDAVLDALQRLASASPPAVDAPPPAADPVPGTQAEREALGALLARFTLGVEVETDAATSGASPDAAAVPPGPDALALLAMLRRAVAALGPQDPPESDEARLARYRADAREDIARATAGWKPPTPTVEELLRMGDDQ